MNQSAGQNAAIAAMSPEEKEEYWNALLKEFREKATLLGKPDPTAQSAPAANNGQADNGQANNGQSQGNRANDTFLRNSGGGGGFRFPGPLNGSHVTSPTGSMRSNYEKVPHNIPIQKFPYGTPGANFKQWVNRFEGAVQVGTNCRGDDRLHELCLQWIPFKMNDDAISIYEQCPSKKRSWPLLKEELGKALEDTQIRRAWVRSLGAYKKPADMSLQLYKAKVTSMVAEYSSATLSDPTAHSNELYNRFVWGLDKDWRESIEDSIPYGKETLDNAFNQALKYEAKLMAAKHVGCAEPVAAGVCYQ